MLLVFLVHIAVTLLCSTLTRSQGAAAGLSFGALLVLLIAGSLPAVGKYFPARLFEWGTALTLGGETTAWPALWMSLALSVAALGAACLIFEHQEL